MSALVYVSFATDADCDDRYCPTSEYGEHTHTLYNVYGIPSRINTEGISEIDASLLAVEILPNQSAPVRSAVKVAINA